MSVFSEGLHAGYRQQFDVSAVLFHEKTEHFDLVIFENPLFGRVMALDGVVQTTEKDEFIYHEMLTHVPLFAHPHPQHVCIVGGGDGGMLREVLKHRAIKTITLVEIDRRVIDLCREFFPQHSQGAFEDSRVNIVIQEGLEYLNTQHQAFDVIISDGTDPVGPGEVLFTHPFYQACHSALTPGGILVTQNGVGYFQLNTIQKSAKDLRAYFNNVSFYTAAVPTYVGGAMMFGWATDDASLQSITIDTLQHRFSTSGIKTKYYLPTLHTAAFALPAYVMEALSEYLPLTQHGKQR